MKLSFFGAAREVTGSCHCIEANGKHILVDCGMQQGSDKKDDETFPFKASEIDCVVVTHAHIDHSGRLPRLVKEGFSGKIYATGATCDLLEIMLRDSAHIQEADAEWDNRKKKRAGKDLIEPFYGMKDAEDAVKLLSGCSYNEDFEIVSGVRVRFNDAGHLLGSSSVEMWITEDGKTEKIVFSGDIGNLDQPIIRDPQYLKEADYVVMEATYGDRNHEHSENHIADLAKIIDDTLAKGGNAVIPSFAVGRTEELLYFIREIKKLGLVKSIPDFPVYVDSPLSAEAIRVFEENLYGYVDKETAEVMNGGEKPLRFSNLNITTTSDESKALNFDISPKIIISSSGMCDAGRIRHHLKHNLWRPECTIVFVGYQANGTLGRILLDGVKQVKLFGEDIKVEASIVQFKGMSAHADRDGLIKWVQAFERKPELVFVNHGENDVCDAFAATLEGLGFKATAPKYLAEYDLAAGAWISEGVEPAKTAPKDAASPVYARLVAAGEKLAAVIRRNIGCATKDLARFADQTLALAAKWER